MAYSYADFPSKVAGNTITVPFPFESRAHVSVTVGGVLVAANKWSWVNDGLISCLAGFPAGAGRVQRTTPDASFAGQLVGTAVLDYPMINSNFTRALYILQEKADVEADRQAQINALGQAVTDSLTTYATSLAAANAARDTAITKAGEAATSATNAQAANVSSYTNYTNSLAQADLAAKWAANPEDVVVSGGLFSARHYALKAAASLASVLNGLAGWIHGATSKGTPVGADEVAIADSAATWGLKKITLTDIKTFITSAAMSITGALTASGNITSGPVGTNGSVILQGGQSIEVGAGRSADGVAFLDLSSVVGADFNFRVIRNTGANGTVQLQNTGTGDFLLSGGGNLAWNGVRIPAITVSTAAPSGGVDRDLWFQV